MIKFTSNNDFNFQCESVSLLRDDSKDLVKRASIKDSLKFEKNPKQEDLHIIAVGAYEGTGFNRNGDAFLEKDCENNHKYFTKSNRAVHRHHKNKPNDPKFGNIKTSAYNKKMRRIELVVGLDKDKCSDILHEQETTGNTNWSMASKQAEDVCFIAGSLVETREALIPIEKVTEDCLVKTHKGNWKRVKKTFKRLYKGDLYELNFQGMPFSVTSTAKHPFLCIPEEQLYVGTQGNGHGKLSRLSPNFITDDNFPTPEWKNADELNEFDYLSYPVYKNNPTADQISEDLAYLLGTYIGDGNLIKRKLKNNVINLNGITITVGKNKNEFLDKLINIVTNLNFKYTIDQNSNISVNRLHIYERSLAILAKRYCNEYSHSKKLNNDVFGWSVEAKKSFLAGYLDTDGMIHHKFRTGRFATVSLQLAYDIRNLLSSLGIASSIFKETTKNSAINGKKINSCGYIYRISIGATSVNTFSKYSLKAKTLGCDKKPSNKIFIVNDYLHLPIKEIHSYPSELEVYNLEVEDDESYIVNGVAVHNCSWCGHHAKTDKDRCFIAGTLIETKAGLKPIELITIGDMVKTHKGNWEKVSHTFKNKYTGNLYTISVKGLPNKITVTGEHPFLGFKYDDIYFGNAKRKDRFDTFKYAKNIGTPTWINSDSLQEEDYLAYPKPINSDKIEVPIELAYLCGAYAGDGNIEKHNGKISGVCFSIGAHETELIKNYVKLSKKLFNTNPYIYQPCSRPDINYLFMRSRELIRDCRMFCGEYARTKAISDQLENWSDESILSFISGYIDTDGCIISNTQEIQISSVNYGLLYQIRKLLLRLNITSSIFKVKYTKKSFGKSGDIYYKLRIGSGWLSSFFPYSIKAKSAKQVNRRIHNYHFIKNEYVFQKITDIDVNYADNINVYNFEVENDNSYIANGVIAHNCEHIPAKLGEINEKGEMCGMINPDPRWFEISYVRRPADRIGMSLGKIASDLTYKPMTSSDYLNLYGELYIPDDILLSKKASDKRELLHKLAELEKHVDMVTHSNPTNSKDRFIKQHGHKLKHSAKMDDSSIDSLRKMEPNLVLKTLADHGIIFSPEDFSRYLFDKRVKPERIEGMKSHLPGIYNKIEQEDAGKAVNDEKFEPNPMGKAPADLKNLAGKLQEDHSLHEGPALRRIMIITISGSLRPKKEATKEASDLEFAKQYAIYKLAMLNYLNDQNKLDDDIMLNSILQNR
jgi:intein/homing endonuclease